MRVAIISDIHANIAALEAVLEDVKTENVEKTYCLGDLVGYAPFPNEVIDRIQRDAIPTIMGNYDDGVGFDRDECGCAYRDPDDQRLGDLSLMWTRKTVRAELKAVLRSLQPEIRFEADASRFRLVHGSPRRMNEYLFEDRPLYSFQRLAASSEADVLVFGHTHKPYTKRVDRVLFVNAGSVGKPKDGDPRPATSCSIQLATSVSSSVAWRMTSRPSRPRSARAICLTSLRPICKPEACHRRPNRQPSEVRPASVATSARSAGVGLARVIADDGPATIELDPTAFFEHGLELQPTSLDAALHSRDRHTRSRGSVRLVDAFKIGQCDCLPVRRRQLADHGRHAGSQLLKSGSLIGLRESLTLFTGLSQILRVAASDLAPSTRRSVVVHDDVSGRAIHPGVEPLRVTQRRESFDHLEEHSLHQIVHVGLIADASANERPQVAV